MIRQKGTIPSTYVDEIAPDSLTLARGNLFSTIKHGGLTSLIGRAYKRTCSLLA